MNRKDVSRNLEELSRLSELAGENPFKARAYARAARRLEHEEEPLEALLRPGALESLPGIGKGTAALIRHMAETGSMDALDEMRASVPEGVRRMLDVRGLGPKKVRTLWTDLGVASPGELQYACVENRLLQLPGFGAKLQARVLEAVRFLRQAEGRVLLPLALEEQANLETALGGLLPGCRAWVGEASLRRETVAALGLLASESEADAAAALGLETLEGGWSGHTEGGLPMRLVRVPRSALGSRAIWETSSKAFREALAERLRRAGLLWCEEGLSRGGAALDTPTEDRFWECCGLAAVPAECRELPDALEVDPDELVQEDDLKGAFHNHTDWSDGAASLEAMAERARDLGWSYIGICDHSASAFYANGLDEGRLLRQREAIAELSRALSPFSVLAGIESDIRSDGSLDYPSGVLETLDVVVASVHSGLQLSPEKQTERLCAAVTNPSTSILGHPSGRILLARSESPYDWRALLDAAASAGIAVELNANPHRLDVDWRRIPEVRAAGLPIAINPDAHSLEGLEDLRFGIWAARKGLARKADVINCLTAREAVARLRRPSV